MRSAHDQIRAEEIEATHRRNGRVCSCCNQSWPCTDYSWATGEQVRVRSVRDHARVLGTGVLLFVLVPTVTSRLLPVWAWWLVLLLDPFVFAAVLYATASSRRSR